MQIISNTGSTNSYIRANKSSAKFWHADTSFMEKPSKFTFLHAKSTPLEGGDTLFLNTRLAYADLATDTKIKIFGLQVCHSFNYLFPKLWANRSNFNLQNYTYPDVFHPLVVGNKSANKSSLYLNKLCVSHIVGLEREESDGILLRLYEHCKKEKYKYTHKWQAGDLVIWDNFSLMHKATFTAPEYPRYLNRTTITGIYDPAVTEDFSLLEKEQEKTNRIALNQC